MGMGMGTATKEAPRMEEGGTVTGVLTKMLLGEWGEVGGS